MTRLFKDKLIYISNYLCITHTPKIEPQNSENFFYLLYNMQ